jgi:catechol 2,3-dioxygenase-like lactoylglutathione lyase family enzyme
MSDSSPQFDQVNLVTRDLEATLAFYRHLGLPVPAEPEEWPPGSGAHHVGVSLPGVSVDFDDTAMATIWHAGVRAGHRGAGTVLGFSLPSRDAVDARYAELLEAGYPGRQPPYDAFWGARYAIVEDPDGRDVGLMSPIDPDRKFTPKT